MSGDHQAHLDADVVVIGTGIGGGTIGHALARAGRRVLFCEMGDGDATPGRLRGHYPELANGRDGAVLQEAEALLTAGRWPEALVDETRARPRRFVPYIGCGVGGSSALYGMAMERFLPADFAPLRHHRDSPGAALVQHWPISHADLQPWYDEAERMYSVGGQRDALQANHVAAAALPALQPAVPWSAPTAALADHLAARGLHPYRLPLARLRPDSCDTCQGFLCARACKVDADRAGVAPAVAKYGAHLLTRCRVRGIEIDGRRVTTVVAERDGQPLRVTARLVVLAAGALQSPLLLRRSLAAVAKTRWSPGQELAGRHLMRHLIDLYLVRPPQGTAGPLDNRHKELAFNDFYLSGDVKLGTVQSFGRLPPAAMLLGALADDAAASPLGAAASAAVRFGAPVLRPVLQDMSERWMALASIVEDLPYSQNMVRADASTGAVLLRYQLADEARRRVARMRSHMAETLRGLRWKRLPQADSNLRIAHVCGTCRFGEDPATSVLDRDNRVHDLDNLFVVDASFMPSSGGTNPSLTIAANALRVAQRINAGLG